MGKDKTILKTTNLSVGYKEKEVLRGLNLLLNKGELTCLLGPNGAGKSTLIRALTGIQKPLSGEVWLQNRLIQDYSQKEIAHQLSLVLTDRVSTGNLTVYALVSLGRFPYTSWMGSLNENDKKLIYWALEVTGTLKFVDRHIGELSDGEKQKVMIARALVQDTDIIILDEPTAHLDSPNRIEIFHLLRQLTVNTGKTILISTHEIDMAIEHSDNMWLIMPGKRVSTGVPEDLILNKSLETAFGSEELSFDYLKGRFQRNQKGSTAELKLSGDTVLVKWTQNALERTLNAGMEVPEITINGDKDKPVWTIPSAQKTFNSIELLIQHLKIDDNKH